MRCTYCVCDFTGVPPSIRRVKPPFKPPQRPPWERRLWRSIDLAELPTDLLIYPRSSLRTSLSFLRTSVRTSLSFLRTSVRTSLYFLRSSLRTSLSILRTSVWKEMKNYAGSENQVIIRKDLLSILKELLKDLPIFLCSSLRTSVSYFAAL